MKELPLEVLRGSIEPKKGELLTPIPGAKYPIRGFVNQNCLKVISSTKAIFKIILGVFTKNFLEAFAKFSVEQLLFYKCSIRSEYFCKSGRVIYKIGLQFIKNERLNKEWNRVLYAFCHIWEFDFPYRYMGQDLFGEMDLSAFKKNPHKETIRLYDIWLNRLEYREGKIHWKKSRWLVWTISKIFNWKFKRLVKSLTQEDLQDLRMDEGDRYWVLTSKYYNFQGRSFSQRFAERKLIDNNL